MTNYWLKNISTNEGLTFLQCSKCKTSTRIYDVENIELLICPNCLSCFSKNHSLYSQLNIKGKPAEKMLIPLYSKCQFNDREYTLIGWAEKYEKGDKYARWHEYTLIDAENNYLTLAMSAGHWTLLEEIECPINYDQNNPPERFRDTFSYKKFSAYYQVTVTARGEFAYDVIDVKNVLSREYISPPFLFAHETKSNKHYFYRGIYKTPAEIASAFKNVSLAFPSRDGVGACQPFYFGINPVSFVQNTIGLIIAIIFFYAIYSSQQKTTLLTSVNVFLPDTTSSVQTASSSFELTGNGPSLIRIDSKSDISNDWVETDMTLVNENTGEERSLTSGLEYYSGYEGGESWTEGDYSRADYINSVSPGLYHLEMTTYSSGSRKTKRLTAEVFRDYPMGWNVLVITISLAVIAGLISYINNYREKQRYGIDDDE